MLDTVVYYKRYIPIMVIFIIYWIIFTLVLRSLSIAKGKMNLEEGIKYRKKLIDDLTTNSDISKSIRNYSPSREESQWIPRALTWRSSKLLKFTLDRRVKEILRTRA